MQLVAARRPEMPAAYIARLLVEPSSRGDGVGRRRLDHPRRAAIEAVRFPFLDVVDISTAASPISRNRHAGWDEIGRVSFDLVGDEIKNPSSRAHRREPAVDERRTGGSSGSAGTFSSDDTFWVTGAWPQQVPSVAGDIDEDDDSAVDLVAWLCHELHAEIEHPLPSSLEIIDA